MMKISRHAKNRMKLYGISTEDIQTAVREYDVIERQEATIAVLKVFPGKYSGYPLKVVYEQADSGILIITAYPLKKKTWR